MCVGELQFEVIQYRLLQEYGASVQMNSCLLQGLLAAEQDSKKAGRLYRYKRPISRRMGRAPGLPAQSEWFPQYRAAE